MTSRPTTVLVTKLFTSGLLAGLTYEDRMSRDLAVVGREVKKPVGGSPYRIIAVHEG